LRIERVSSGERFLQIGETVAIGIGVGIERRSVEKLFPNVTHVVGVKVELLRESKSTAAQGRQNRRGTAQEPGEKKLT
jgi:hypothetical protein